MNFNFFLLLENVGSAPKLDKSNNFLKTSVMGEMLLVVLYHKMQTEGNERAGCII